MSCVDRVLQRWADGQKDRIRLLPEFALNCLSFENSVLLQAFGMAVIMDVPSGKSRWEGEPDSLDRVLRVRAWFTESMEGVNAANFDSTVFLSKPSQDFFQEQMEKEFQHEQHLLRRELRQNTVLFEQMTERMLIRGALSKPEEDELASAFPSRRDTLLDLASELQLQQNWSSIAGDALQDALYESLVNSADFSSDETKGPIVLSRILDMVRMLETHVAKMQGKSLIFLVGDTGSGKSTTASYLMKIKLEEERGPMGRAWNHKDLSGPAISPSWSASQTLYAESFVAGDLGSSFAIVDTPGFEDTRGDAYRLVTGLSLDRAVAVASCIPSLVLTVPYALISEKRGQAMLELLAKVRGRFPNILNPEQFDVGHVDQGLHIIVTKANRPHAEQVRAIETGAFAREALKHCSENLKRFESSPLDARVLKEHSRMWQTLHLLAGRKRIHVLDLGNRKQRKDLLQSFMRSRHGLCTKPDYGTTFHDPKSQKVLEVFVSVAAHTWRGFFGKLRQKYPDWIRRTEKRLAEVQHESEELMKQRDEQRRNLADTLSKWRQLKKDLGTDGGAPEDLLHLLEEQAAQDVAEANSSASACDRRLRGARDRLADAKEDANSVQINISALQAQIKRLKSGSTDVDVYSHQYAGTMAVVGDCGGETMELALEAVREWNFSNCKSRQEFDVSTYKGTLWHYAYIPRGYRLIPAVEEQRKRFQVLLSEEETFGSTVAKVSGSKYMLQARKASPDGRTIVSIFEFHFDASQPYPSVQVVHRIPNIDFNEARLRNADAELTDLLSRKAGADATKSSAQEEVESLETKCAGERSKVDEIILAGKLKEVDQRIEFSERQLTLFAESDGAFQADRARLLNETSALTRELSELRRKHAQLAFTIKGFYHKVVPALVQMSEFVRNILTSGAVNRDVFQELDSFLKVHAEANPSGMKEPGILVMAGDVLAQYRNISSGVML